MDIAVIVLVQILYAIATLALISAGLAIIFGMMRVINLAHGEFLMLGAYTVIICDKAGINLWVSMLIIAPLFVGLVGLVVERLVIRFLYGRMIDTLLVDLFLDSERRPPAQVVLDLDATDDAVHGNQEGRFFHGYYGHYCYLPLYLTCGEHVLCCRLRRADADAADGAVDELAPLVAQIRQRWPATKILVRGDSGFCREQIMAWCEGQGIDYVLGLARNARLQQRIDKALRKSRRRCATTGQASRRFRELRYRTLKSWSRHRRVVAKAEWLAGARGGNPRFVVTSLDRQTIAKQALYEELYCARGDMENRIKEQQLWLFADRTSAATMRANQVRLYFSAFAGILLTILRRAGLQGTVLANARFDTIRSRLIKLAGRITVSVRRVRISFSSVYPLQELFAQALAALRAAPVRVAPG
jgi:hypothetical protein